MDFLKSFFSDIWDIVVYAMFLIIIVDYVLIFYVNRHFPNLDSPYFNVHRVYGFTKVNIVKLLAVFAVINAMWISRSGKEIYFAVAVIAYGYYVFDLFVDLIKARINADNSNKDIKQDL